jgi:hypothetical protein
MRSGRSSHRINRVQTIVAVAALAVGVTAVPIVVSSASAAAPAKPTGGTIHVDVIDTSLSPTAPNKVLITGAFSDHGTGKHGTFHLTKGTITANTSALKAIINSPKFGTFYANSCSFTGVATGPVAIVSGTGAYAGIHGTLTATDSQADQGSLLKNGKCNQSNNAPAVAQDVIVTASGKVSF